MHLELQKSPKITQACTLKNAQQTFKRTNNNLDIDLKRRTKTTTKKSYKAERQRRYTIYDGEVSKCIN